MLAIRCGREKSDLSKLASDWTVAIGWHVPIETKEVGPSLPCRFGSEVMLVQTTRFGQIDAQQKQVLVFPQGLIGFEACRHWLIVPDPHNADVAWLQSLSQMQVALPMVSPRKFRA